MNGTLVDRAAGFLESRLSRRSFISRSAMVGSALAAAGTDFVLTPGTAYSVICNCAQSNCDCGSACCSGFSEFCCTVNGGYNYCPSGTTIGGWWRADGSVYCDGPRYYLDCNANCRCTTGCDSGFPFCEPSCDGVTCACAGGSCDNWVSGCFQFRYGQCNQDVACMGRIVCRVVSCVPPWEVDPTCTTTNAEDDGTANMNVACNTAVPVPPPPPCDSAATQCQVVGITSTTDGGGYTMVTSFGKVFCYGDAADLGDMSTAALVAPLVGIASCSGGYFLAAADGGIFAFGDAPFYGSMGGQPLDAPMVGMAVTPTGAGYWTVAADGGIFAFGDAPFYGSMGGQPLDAPMVGMAVTPTGAGYWTVAADGGIFAFGDAPFYGSMGGQPLDAPMVGMAVTPTGAGYWTVAADGGIFAFGDAPFDGSMGGISLQRPVVGVASPPNGQGYWLVGEDGGVFSFDEPFYGAPT